MDQSALEVASGVSVETIKRLEGMEGQLSETRVATINAIQAALEKAGVTFIAENGGGPGVRLKKTAKGVEEISQEIEALEDKISSMPAPTEPSPEAGMNVDAESCRQERSGEAQKPPHADHTTRPLEMSAAAKGCAQCGAVTGLMDTRLTTRGTQCVE